MAVISNLSWWRKICHTYCFDAIYWLVGKQELVSRDQGEKVPSLRPVNVSIFCHTKPQRTLPSEGNSIQFPNILNLRIYFFISKSWFALFTFTDWSDPWRNRSGRYSTPLSLDTPSNSCCQQSLWGWLDKINWNFQINLTHLIGETSETSNIKQTGKSKCVLFADRVHNALVEFWNNDKVIISRWRASLLPTVSRYCHFHPNYDDDDVQGVQRWRNGSSWSQTTVGLPSPAWTTKDRRDTMDHSVKAITNHRKVNPAFEWKSALFGPF